MATDPMWIEHMHLKEGALHENTDTPAGQKIPAKKLAKAENSSNPTVAKRAHVAATLKAINKRK